MHDILMLNRGASCTGTIQPASTEGSPYSCTFNDYYMMLCKLGLSQYCAQDAAKGLKQTVSNFKILIRPPPANIPLT